MGMNFVVCGYDGHVQFKVIAFEAKDLSSNTKRINDQNPSIVIVLLTTSFFS